MGMSGCAIWFTFEMGCIRPRYLLYVAMSNTFPVMLHIALQEWGKKTRGNREVSNVIALFMGSSYRDSLAKLGCNKAGLACVTLHGSLNRTFYVVIQLPCANLRSGPALALGYLATCGLPRVSDNLYQWKI
jgi:hypothetical protein